jgi:Transglutaminase-like superfamily
MSLGDPATSTAGGSTPPRKRAGRALAGFMRLDSRDRLLVLQAALLLGAVRVALVVVPFVRLRRVMARLARPPSHASGTDAAREAWAVSAASRYVPGARHCLTQALVGQVLLGRAGVPSHVRIGLSRGERGDLHGHAWLEAGGRIVIGGGEADSYKPVDSFGGGLR